MTRRLIPCSLLLLLLLVPVFGAAADEAKKPANNNTAGKTASPNADLPKERNSPRAAMFSFLSAMKALNKGDDAQWPKVYAVLGQPNPDPESAHILKRRALKLIETLDYIGRVEESELPDSDQTTGDYFAYFPQPFNQTHDRAVSDIGEDKLTIALS